MSTFSTLPNELLARICSWLEPRDFQNEGLGDWYSGSYAYSALCNLSLVSKHIRAIAQPHLYSTVRVRTDNALSLLRTLISRKDLASKTRAIHSIVTAADNVDIRSLSVADSRTLHQALLESGCDLVAWTQSSLIDEDVAHAIVELTIFFTPEVHYIELTPPPHGRLILTSSTAGRRAPALDRIKALSFLRNEENSGTEMAWIYDILQSTNVSTINIEWLFFPDPEEHACKSVRELNLYQVDARVEDWPRFLRNFTELRSLSVVNDVDTWINGEDELSWFASDLGRVLEVCQNIVQGSRSLEINTFWPALTRDTQEFPSSMTIQSLSKLESLEILTIDRYDLVSSRGICFIEPDETQVYKYAQAEWQEGYEYEFEKPREPFLGKLPTSLRTLQILRGDRSLEQELRRLPDAVKSGQLKHFTTLQLAPWTISTGQTQDFAELAEALKEGGIKVEAVEAYWNGDLMPFKRRNTRWGCEL